MARRGLPVIAEEEDRGDEAQEDEQDVVLDEMAEADDGLGDPRKGRAEFGENVGKNGDDLPKHENGHQDGETEDGHGIDHGLPDLAAQLDGLLDVFGQPLEHDIQRAALFPRGHEIAVEVVKDLGKLALGLVQAGAGLDVRGDAGDDFLEVLVVRLFGQDVQALDQRKLGVDEHGQLAAVDGELFEFDLFRVQEGDLERLAPERDAGDLDLFFLQNAGEFLGRPGDAFAVDGVAVAILAFPRIEGHGRSFLALRAWMWNRVHGTRLPPLDDVGELLRKRGDREGHFAADLLLEIELGQRLVERLHPRFFLGQLHLAVDHVQLALADEVADGRVGDEDLHSQDAASAVGPGQEGLGQDRFQGHREHDPDLGLVLRREDVDDARNRLRGRVGMQGGEGQVPRFGYPDGHLHGFQVAHFADQDDIGILAQDGPQGIGIGQRVGEQLALVDQRFLGGEKILDGVFDGDNVDRPLGVDVLDHAGQARRLAAPGGPGDEDEAAG